MVPGSNPGGGTNRKKNAYPLPPRRVIVGKGYAFFFLFIFSILLTVASSRRIIFLRGERHGGNRSAYQVIEPSRDRVGVARGNCGGVVLYIQGSLKVMYYGAVVRARGPFILQGRDCNVMGVEI